MLCCCHVYSILKENSKTPTTSLQDTKGTAPATAAHGNAGATDVHGDSPSPQGGCSRLIGWDLVRFIADSQLYSQPKRQLLWMKSSTNTLPRHRVLAGFMWWWVRIEQGVHEITTLRGDQTWQIYGSFEGFSLHIALFGLVISWSLLKPVACAPWRCPTGSGAHSACGSAGACGACGSESCIPTGSESWNGRWDCKTQQHGVKRSKIWYPGWTGNCQLNNWCRDIHGLGWWNVNIRKCGDKPNVCRIH